jgi:hypothetical protein
VIPNVLVIGEPGSGKSVAAARDACEFPGAALVLDPHRDSLGRLVLEHATGNVLFDRLSDLDCVLGYELLKPSTHPDARKRAQQNERRARLFVEVMMRRRGGDIAASPLMEEWVMALLIGFLNQRTPKPVRIIPFGFLPGTEEFQSFFKDITLPEIQAKFQQLIGLKPRALRAEVGSATRLVDAIFRSPAFLPRCDASFDLGAFLQDCGKLVVERGDENEDVARTIMGGIILLVTDHCESRATPWPPVRIYLDECTNARTAGNFEERKAGETRKYGLSWYFMCQYPNFPNGPDGFFANCQRKETYRVGHYELARKLASMYVAGLPAGEETRANRIDAMTTSLMTLKPGWRWVTDRNGPCQEYVPMLESGWPDWPGLREAKLHERLCEIYARPEYRTFDGPSDGDPETPPSSPSSPDTPPRPSNSPAASSPAERWNFRRKKRTNGSHDSDGVGE